MRACKILLGVMIIALAVSVGMIISEAMDNHTDAIIKKLEAIAQKENVPVYYVPRHQMLELKERYHLSVEPGGLYCYPDIYIDVGYHDIYAILAHEIGHHYATQFEDDTSEERATEIGRQLVERGEYVPQ